MDQIDSVYVVNQEPTQHLRIEDSEDQNNLQNAYNRSTNQHLRLMCYYILDSSVTVYKAFEATKICINFSK